MPKEGILMRLRLLIPVMTFAALLGLGAAGVRAGSFLGPVCYGARYTEQYPNRSHNVFGCGPGCHCQAWHGFFRHRLIRRYRGVPNDGIPADVMPGYGMPPVQAMHSEYLQTPVVQSPAATAPIHMTSVEPAPVPAAPAVQSRIVPVPAPMPAGPVRTELPKGDSSGKPPF
jgi:hypothetical protein